MRRTVLAVLAVLSIVAVPAASAGVNDAAVHHSHYYKHHPECHHPACVKHANDLYNKHKQKERERREARELSSTAITTFDLCVANRENGEPGATSFNTINWQADNNYEGAFSWEPSKWAAGGGLKYAPHPYDATPREQVAVFHQNGKNGEWTPSNWPTIPPCEGLPGS